MSIPVPRGLPSSPSPCWVVRVSGEIDLDTSPALADVLGRVPPDTTSLVVDLADVTFMDCSALPALLQASRRFGTALSLRGPGRPVLRLLEATGLDSRFAVQQAAEPCPVAGGAFGHERCPGVRLRLGGPLPPPEPPEPPDPPPVIDDTTAPARSVLLRALMLERSAAGNGPASTPRVVRQHSRRDGRPGGRRPSRP